MADNDDERGSFFQRVGFEEWYNQVDMEIERISSLSLVDLADQPLLKWFQQGIKSSDAAVMVLKAEGWSV